MLYSLMQVNYAAFVEFNEHAGVFPWLDALMVFCANSLILCWPLLLLIAWGLPAGWRRHTLSPTSVLLIQERRAAVLWTAIACLISYAVNITIEQFVNEPRPFISHHVHLLASHVADASFPSDHTAWSFAVVGMLTLCLFSWAKIAQGTSLTAGKRIFGLTPKLYWVVLLLAFAMACLVGLARIFIGVHYPGDILGGALSGSFAALLATWLRRWLHMPTERVIQFAQRLHLA